MSKQLLEVRVDVPLRQTAAPPMEWVHMLLGQAGARHKELQAASGWAGTRERPSARGLMPAFYLAHVLLQFTVAARVGTAVSVTTRKQHVHKNS